MLTVRGVQLLVSGTYPADDECFIFQAIDFAIPSKTHVKCQLLLFWMAFAILSASYLLSYTLYFMETYLSKTPC
jgi:hypothetical protein